MGQKKKKKKKCDVRRVRNTGRGLDRQDTFYPRVLFSLQGKGDRGEEVSCYTTDGCINSSLGPATVWSSLARHLFFLSFLSSFLSSSFTIICFFSHVSSFLRSLLSQVTKKNSISPQPYAHSPLFYFRELSHFSLPLSPIPSFPPHTTSPP